MGKIDVLFKKKLEKVNVQVSLLTCALVVFSCLVMYLVTSWIMVSLLADAYNERANLTFQTIESHIDKKLYEDDLSDSGYGAVMSYLTATQDDMAVSEIFIIKQDKDDYVCILDTADADTQDGKISRKLSKKIKNKAEDLYLFNYIDSGFFANTESGYRYMNFYPATAGGTSIKGVIGIAIDAQKVHTVKMWLRILAVLIIILCCFISTRFSKAIFKKISNPLYQDETNTDALTGLKNKNSFSVDLHNIEGRNTERYAVATIDLNGLKHINDTRGHQAGDLYIQRAGTVIKRAVEGTEHIGYRMGGDEFTVVMKDVSLGDIQAFVEKINAETAAINRNSGLQLSMSIGYAKFNPDKDRNFSMTMERSDAMMYENKRLYYKEKNMTPR